MWHSVAVLVLFASLVVANRNGPEHPVCPENRGCVYDKDSSVKENHMFIYNLKGYGRLTIYYEREVKYIIQCENTPSTEISVVNSNLPALTELDEVAEVEINDCYAPSNTSYYDAIKSWNVMVTQKLYLNGQYARPVLQNHHLRGLQIHELEISAKDINDQPRPSQDFLIGVQGLKTLRLHNVIPDAQAFMRLPDTLETLDLLYAQVPTAVSKLDNGRAWLERLPSLKILKIQEQSNNVAESLTLPNFNEFLPHLTILTLTSVSLNSSSLSGKLNGSSIKELILYSSRLNVLPDNLFEGANLTKLVINSHNLSVPRGVFLPLQWLTDMDLSRNNLNVATLIDVVSSLPRLQNLKANRNPLGTLCGDADIPSAKSMWPNSLRELHLVQTKATRICPDWVENDQLMNINLQKNEIGAITYNDLRMTRAERGPVILNLSDNPKLRVVNVSIPDIRQCGNSSLKDSNNRTRVKVKLIIRTRDKQVTCDYGAVWLREALYNCPLWLVPGNSNSDTGDILCQYRGDCLPGCSCKNRPRDNATVVNCKGTLPRAPKWPPSSEAYPLALHVKPGMLTAVPTNTTLVELHAPNNHISRLDDTDITDTLIILDVSNNSIQHISQEAARRLTAGGINRSVKLNGNRLDCTCFDVPAYELLASSKVVIDWNETLCADNIKISEKMRSGLCFPVLYLVMGLACLGLLLLILGLLLYRYKPQIRQVLFKLNCCRRYVFRVTDKDSQKEKDAFLSYNNEDIEQIIILKNALEDRGYSTIEHNRDFEPGEPILSQIEDSVQKARRTVVFVSDNFIQSKWMPHEFRYAHGHALKHQTSKVIVIRYNLSVETTEKLPTDLRFYIKHHTYLDWHDERFWEKLFMVLGTPRFQFALFN